ncbi:MAG: class I SAM-dependent methyltransferase [Kofleriaceae bacterium]
MLARARHRTGEDGVTNATYELGDAQVHPFPPASFDVVISRFGTMFFADPAAAFAHLARAARPGARLVMMVWQGREQNEWATAIRGALEADPLAATGLDPFSLSDPATVAAILAAAGFADIDFADVREPVYYGPDAAAALDLVRDMKGIRTHLAKLASPAAQRAVSRVRAMLTAHQTDDGVLFDARAWIVTARRSAS